MALITLADTKGHLRYPAGQNADDAAIQRMANAAEEVIRNECGEVSARQFDESYDGGSTQVNLRHLPLLSVQQVTENWGWVNYTLTRVESGQVPITTIYAYSVDSRESGTIVRRTAGNVVIPFAPGQSNVNVVYTAGRANVPPVLQLAALELVAHWWQNTQLRAGAGGGMQYDTINEDYTRATGVSMINQGVPYRILEMIRPYRRQPIIG